MPTLTLNAELRTDPTQSTELRARYARAAGGRFKVLRRILINGIVEEDMLGLVPRPRITLFQLQHGGSSAIPPTPRLRHLPSNEAKTAAFLTWLRELEQALLLEDEGEFQQQFLRGAYVKGLRQADIKMRREGISVHRERISSILRQPAHTAALSMLFISNFQELRGITAAADQAISRILIDGFVLGWGPREIGRQISREIERIGIVRATALARTQIIRAHAEATLNRFEQTGLRLVVAQVEFATAADDRVCPTCEALEGNVFTIDEAHGIIPVHINCRCAWLPA